MTLLFAILDSIGAIPICLMYDQPAEVGYSGKLLGTTLVTVFAFLFFILSRAVMLQRLHISVADLARRDLDLDGAGYGHRTQRASR
ncbi:MAG: hypothetical protein ABSG92_03875 [Conexivisphaerales archaeon]